MEKVWMLAIALALPGCATFEAADHVHRGSPRFFAGTRIDVAAITENEAALDYFKEHGMTPPRLPGLDLAPSFCADTVLLPIVVGYTITEPLIYWIQDP